MSDILVELTEARRADAAAREAKVPFAEMMRRAESAEKVRNFAAAFAPAQPPNHQTTKPPNHLTTALPNHLTTALPNHIIAELKRASPSEGMIREDFRPLELARELAEAGAAALSVLCEPHRFLGGEDYLAAVRKIVDLPLLYKDFLSTRYQVAAARAAGADAVLLIAAVLDDAALMDLLIFARSLGLEALVETHDAEEIARAVNCGAKVVGVNCRNLRNFATDVSLLERLIGEIPSGLVRIAESGMHTAEAVARAKAAGASGFLVGTALMRSPSPGAKLKELIG